MACRTDIVGRKWVDVFPELVDRPTHDLVRAVYGGKSLEVKEVLVPLV